MFSHPILTAKQSISHNSFVAIDEILLDAFIYILFNAYVFVSSMMKNENISKNGCKP